MFQAGQACWQRPHSVQVKPSSRSFQPRSWSVFRPNVAFSASRSISGSSPRGRELAEADVEEARGDVEVLAEGQVDRNAATSAMCAHHRTAKPPPGPRARARTAGAREGGRHERAGLVAVGANSKTWASSSVATTPPIIDRMISASRLKVRRAGREIRRRSKAHRIDRRTRTATTFCIALTSAQRSPSKGSPRTSG